MADETKKAESASPATAGGGRKKKTLLIVGILMVLEGVGVFALVHLMRPAPSDAIGMAGGMSAGEGEKGEGEASDPAAVAGEFAEVVIGPSDAVNSRDGRPYVYHVEVTALVRQSKKDTAKMLVEARGATIRDRIDTVLRNADPKILAEPGLETLRRQLKSEFDRIAKDEKLIEEVLITKFLRSRSGL